MELDLTNYTEEELVELRRQINDRISEFRKLERSEEEAILANKYEGKYFLHEPTGDVYYVKEVLNKYWVDGLIFHLEHEDDMVTEISFIHKQLNGLFQPKMTLTTYEPSIIGQCTELTVDEVKKIIRPYLKIIQKEFLED